MLNQTSSRFNPFLVNCYLNESSRLLILDHLSQEDLAVITFRRVYLWLHKELLQVCEIPTSSAFCLEVNHPWEVGTPVSPHLSISISLWLACLGHVAGTCCNYGAIHTSNICKFLKESSIFYTYYFLLYFYTYFFIKNSIDTAENIQFIFIKHSLMPSEF